MFFLENEKLSKFYEKPIEQRRLIVKELANLTDEEITLLEKSVGKSNFRKV